MIKVKIKKINMHNFLSFQDEEWNFDNTSPLVLIKGENKDTESPLGNTSNGSGKSAWSHALMYALFGQLNGKFHNENIKNDYADTILDGFKMSVTVEVDVSVSRNETRHWQIVRGLQKGKSAVVLQLYALEDDVWKDISKSSSANTQKFIEENVIFMNFETYQRVVMLSVEDKYNFFKLNASQKRDFIETLFDTSVYSSMYRMMSEDIKSRNVILQNLKVNHVKLEKTKELCEDEVERYKSGINDKIDETKKERDSILEKVSELESSFPEIHKKREAIEYALENVRKNKARLDEIISQCNDIMTNSRIEINNYNTTISHHERELNKHREVLGMICDDCKKVVDKFYSLDVYRSEIEELKEKISKEEKKIENSNIQIGKVKEYDDKLKSEEVSMMNSLSDNQVEERNLQFQKTTLLKSVKNLERKIEELVESIENENKIPSYAIYRQTLDEIDSVEKELKEESVRMCMLQVGNEIVSPDSIRKNIISKVVASINGLINRNLSELCVNFTCSLSSDMNDYAIMAGDNEVDLDLRSAGERMKLLISSQLAFRKFLMSRFNVCMNVMIIDEVVDRALDSVSIQKLLGLLLQLSQKENTNIYIISHRGEVEQMFNTMADTQTLVIQKKDNISRIIRE